MAHIPTGIELGLLHYGHLALGQFDLTVGHSGARMHLTQCPVALFGESSPNSLLGDRGPVVKYVTARIYDPIC
jgi:hypothetical protein